MNYQNELSNGARLYLDLLKKTLTFYLWGEPLSKYVPPKDSSLRSAFVRFIVGSLEKEGKRLFYEPHYDALCRIEGRDHPFFAHTMVGLKRLDNLQNCILAVLKERVPGDLIETGVWRGGTVIFMKAVLKAMNEKNRTVWVADSFEGLPMPNPKEYPVDKDDIHHTIDYLAVGIEEVKKNFETYDLLDSNVKFLKGWFKDTLHRAPIHELSILRLDGDMYESTMDALSALYPKLSLGGFIIIDDYGAINSCKQAVADYREKNNITEKIEWADWSGIYWKKER